MANDKSFLTYNQQMKKLRKDKRIDCNGTPHKISLVRSGYFNMINGYKMPFTCRPVFVCRPFVRFEGEIGGGRLIA